MSEKRDKFITIALNTYVIILAIFIFIVYFAPLPNEVKDLINGFEIENVSGKIIPISDTYKEILIVFVRTSAVIDGVVTFLAAIFLIGKRNIFEIFAIFEASMLPREKKYWGVVYDSKSRSPFAFVKVALYDTSNSQKKFLTQAITDLYGRYRANLPRNISEMSVEVNVPGYLPYFSPVDQKFAKFFSFQFVQDIPLEKAIGQHRNPIQKLITFLRPRFYSGLFSIIFILPFINIPLGIFFILNNPIIINFVSMFESIVAVAWNIFVLTERRSFRPGRVIDATTMQPVKGALVKIFNDNTSGSIFSDAEGTGKFDLESGIYMCQVYATGYELRNNAVDGSITVKLTKEGYIQNDISLDRLPDFERYKAKTGLNKLLNPFE